MSEYLIQEETLQDIADAIRDVNGRKDSYTMEVSTYAEEIGKLDPHIVNYADGLENGYYGVRAANVAATYLAARVTGQDKFAYRTYAIFSAGNNPPVREGAYGRIDCSTFIGLCLRGITYENSPYAKHTEENITWTPSTELASMYGTDGWEFTCFDKQPSGLFNDIGITGYSTLRLAADIGQFFYKNGYVLWDQSQGTLTAMPEGLQPGDLIFWANSDNKAVQGRFMSISHVGMVAENAERYYHVTGSESQTGQTVVNYAQFGADSYHPISDIVLIARPDYRPRKPKEETPLNANLLSYPWTVSRNKSFTVNGITYTVTGLHTLSANGTCTKNGTFRLKGYKSTSDHTTLSPGTYELSGITGRTGTTYCLQLLQEDETDFPTRVRYPTDSDSVSTLTVTEETDVVVKLWAASGATCIDETITPKLIRTK